MAARAPSRREPPRARRYRDPVQPSDAVTPSMWHPSRRLLLIGLFSLVTVVATEAMAVATVMPVVERDLGDLFLYGWVFSAFQLGTLVGIVVGGRAADRTNPATPLAAGLAVFCIGLVIAGAAPSMWLLVAGRALQGFGAGAIPTVAYVCVGRGFPAELRPKVFAVLSTAWVLPSLVAPLAASGVARAFGWRWVFLGLIPVALVVGGIAVHAVRSLGRPAGAGHPEGGRVGIVARLALGAAVLLGGLTAGAWWLAVPVTALGLVLVVPAFRDLTPAGTMSLRPRLPAAVGLRGLLTFAFFASDAFVPLAVISVRGQSTVFAGLVLATGAITWTLGSWTQARLAEPWGPARLVRAGLLLVAVGYGIDVLGLLPGVPVAVWFVGEAVACFGIGLAYSPLAVVTLGEADPGREGAATTALQLSDVLGVALGTGAAGAIVALGDRFASSNTPALTAVLALSIVVAVAASSLAGRLVQPTATPRSDTVMRPSLP